MTPHLIKVLLRAEDCMLEGPNTNLEDVVHCYAVASRPSFTPCSAIHPGVSRDLSRSMGSVALAIDTVAILWFPPGLAVCEELGADPWGTLGSGTLLATFPPGGIQEAVEDLRRHGYQAAPIGAVEEGSGVRDRAGETVSWPPRDEVARILSH